MGVNREVEARKYVASSRVMALSEPGLYLVANGRGENYVVDLVEHSCTCPDFTYRGVRCKHLIAAEMKDQEIKEQIWRSVQRHPSLRLIGNGSLTDADTSTWNSYEKRLIGGDLDW